MLVVNLYGLYFDQFPSLPSGTDLMTSIFGTLAQSAEATDLKSVQSGFESQGCY